MSLICSRASTQLCQRRLKPYIWPLQPYSVLTAVNDVAFVAFVHWSVARGSIPFVGPNRSGGSVSVVLADSCDNFAGGFCTSCAETTEKPRIASSTAIRKYI